MIAKESDPTAGSTRGLRLRRSIGLSRLLVVEWDSEVREQLCAVAGGHGFEVASCPSAHEAAKLCEANDFDAIVVDSALYGMECAEFIRWVRETAESDSFVLVAGQSGTPEEARAMLKAGADDCVAKPVTAEALATRLAVMEHRKEAEGERENAVRQTRRNHARFESIFMESPDAVLVLKNREGKIIGVNRAVKTILGYDGKGLLGKYLSLVFPELFSDKGLSSFGSFLKNANAVQCVAFRCPDGTRKMLDLQLTSIPWDKGFALLLNCRDVTERESAAARADDSAKEEALRLLAGGISGDVNDLTTSICGNLELLEGQPFVGGEAADLLQRARRACDRVRALGEDLSAVAGIASRPAVRSVKVRPLVEKTAQFALFGAQNIRPVFRFAEELHEVAADERQFAYALGHLVENATQAMSGFRASGRIRIDATNATIAANGATALALQPGAYVRISVRDQGPGVAEADRDRLFDPYFTTRRNGRGLGLARVRAIARAHGGDVEVEASLGDRREQGAAFHLYLPAAKGARANSGSKPRPGAGKRVLFLDDEPDIRLMVERALGTQGFEVYTAATGEEAIRVCKRAEDFGRPFDLLLLDLQIRGGLGGRETLGILREDTPNIKAVVTTGYVDDAVLANHGDFGFCGVLAKPFRIDQLVSVVSKLCGCSADAQA